MRLMIEMLHVHRNSCRSKHFVYIIKDATFKRGRIATSSLFFCLSLLSISCSSIPASLSVSCTLPARASGSHMRGKPPVPAAWGLSCARAPATGVSPSVGVCRRACWRPTKGTLVMAMMRRGEVCGFDNYELRHGPKQRLTLHLRGGKVPCRVGRIERAQ